MKQVFPGFIRSIRGQLIVIVLIAALPIYLIIFYLQWNGNHREFDVVLATATLLAIAGLGYITSYSCERLVLRWTTRLATTVDAVEQGDYHARVGAPYAKGELGALARTLDAMLDQVELRNQQVETREQWFRAVVQHLNDLILITDAEGIITYASAAVETILGQQPDKLIGTSVFGLIHPDESNRLTSIFRYVTYQPGRFAAAEYRVCHSTGRYIEVESIIKNLLADVAVKGIVVNSRDITRRRRTEEMLRLVTSGVDQARDGVLIVTSHTASEAPRIVYVNAALQQLLALESSQLLNEPLEALRDQALIDALNRSIANGMSTGDPPNFDIDNVLVENRILYLAVQMTALKDYEGGITHFVAICHDASEARLAELERQKLESSLRQAQKMEAVGTLAGGIAHDFNNVLLPMMMLTQLTLNRLAPQSREHQDLTRVLGAQQRAKSLVRQILTFSRSNSGEYLPIRLKPVVEESLTLLRASLPATVVLLDSLDDVPPVYADSTQMQQILMNLCSNAAQAMPSGKGQIKIKLETVALNGETIPGDLKPGHYAKITVGDDGVGIPAPILNRIFDPFFTTKEVGVGTGLGLSVAHGIIHAHQGDISVQSSEGEGTIFTVLLPLIEDTDSLAQHDHN